jgi:hypothetical protein
VLDAVSFHDRNAEPLVGVGASLVQPPTLPEQLHRVYELLLGLAPDENQEKGP